MLKQRCSAEKCVTGVGATLSDDKDANIRFLADALDNDAEIWQLG